MTEPFEIAGRPIGAAHSPYLIAEISGNHNGDLGKALRLVEAAQTSGADAVKLQTYTADTITIDHDGPEFTIEQGLWKGRTLHDLYEEAHTPWEWHEELFAKARQIGITIFSSPFDGSAVDLLEGLDAPAYKIASFEIVDLPLIQRVAKAGKPMIISTGLASLDEIKEAIGAAREAGAPRVALLHCVSAYPAPPRDANLAAMRPLRERFGVEVGLSDHTLGNSVAIAATALGASIIEKHLTLLRADGGPDAEFSMEPQDLAQLSTATKTAWESVGTDQTGIAPSEEPNLILRRSLYVVEDVEAGQVFTERNVRSIRPGLGLPPKHLPQVLGATASRSVGRGTPLSWELVTDGPNVSEPSDGS